MSSRRSGLSSVFKTPNTAAAASGDPTFLTVTPPNSTATIARTSAFVSYEITRRIGISVAAFSPSIVAGPPPDESKPASPADPAARHAVSQHGATAPRPSSGCDAGAVTAPWTKQPLCHGRTHGRCSLLSDTTGHAWSA